MMSLLSRAMTNLINIIIDHENDVTCNQMQFKFRKLKKFIATFPKTENQHASWEITIGTFGADFKLKILIEQAVMQACFY